MHLEIAIVARAEPSTSETALWDPMRRKRGEDRMETYSEVTVSRRLMSWQLLAIGRQSSVAFGCLDCE
jgi:hypothetical protein